MDSSLSETFECPVCSENTLEKPTGQLQCSHLLCLECIERVRQHGDQRCPICRSLITGHSVVTWPKRELEFVMDKAKVASRRWEEAKAERATLDRDKQRAELEAERLRAAQQQQQRLYEERLRAVEVERNRLLEEQQRIHEDLDRERESQRDLQHEQQRAVLAKETEIAKLRLDIAAMEQHQSSQNQAEIEGARRRVALLEEEARAREAAWRARMQELEQQVAAHVAQLRDRELALSALRAPEPAVAEDAAAAAAADEDEQSPLYGSLLVGSKWMHSALDGGVETGRKAIGFVGRLLRPLFQGKPSALMWREADFEVLERRGTHCASSVWRAAVRPPQQEQQQEQQQQQQQQQQQSGEEREYVALKYRVRSNDAFREAMLLHTLSHPNIVPLLGLAESLRRPNHVALVLPFWDTDLEYWLSKESAKNVMLKRDHILFQILCAVSYLHQQGVVHRALSPACVMLEPRPDGSVRARLVSWTNAASLASPAPLPRLVGRAGRRHRSPELFVQGQELVRGAAWKAVDVWAVGAIAWDLLGERAPPLIVDATQDVASVVGQLLQWRELPDLAVVDPSPLVASALRAAELRPPRSLLDSLAFVAEPMRALLLSLLQWDAAKRCLLSDAVCHEVFSAFRDTVAAGVHVKDERVLSDLALAEWIAKHVDSSE